MPNISEFRQQCAALGLDHIEVVKDYIDNVHALTDIIENGIVKKDKISEITYFQYENDLKNTDIVFFSEDVEFNSIVFLGNSIIFTEKNKTDASWIYDTHQITVPITGGTRTFDQSSKDELIAQGIIGITASSINDVDQYNNYLDSSLFGKIESKINSLKIADGRDPNGTIDELQIPWMYNMMIFGNRHYFKGYAGMASATKMAADYTNDLYPLYLVPKSLSVQQTVYGLQTLHRTGTYGINDNMPGDLETTLLCLQEFLQRQPVMHNWDGHTSNGHYEWYPIQNFDLNTSPRVIRYSNCYLQGGYNPQTTSADLVYKEPPYLIGMVLWITDIFPNDNKPAAWGYIIPVALDRKGKIIKPCCPYQSAEVNDIVINGTVYSNGQQIKYEDVDTAIAEDYNIIPIPDNSSFSPLKGNLIFFVNLPMSPDEISYNLGLKYIIAPEDYIPDNYLEGE